MTTFCQKWIACLPLPGTSNLHLYLQEATLPELDVGEKVLAMPQIGHKSHANYLNVREEMWRKLRTMEKLVPDDFDEDVLKCE